MDSDATMEIVAAKENPNLKMVGEDMVGYGGGVIGGVFGLELLNPEVEGRAGKGVTALVDAVVSGLSFVGAAGMDGIAKKLLIGVGAAGAAEAVSTAVQAFRGQ